MKARITLVVAVFAVASVLVLNAAGGAAAAGLGGAPESTDVTLVTGDVVHVTERTDGKRTVTVTPADRKHAPSPSFLKRERDGELIVIPQDVLPLVPERLDPALFNVTGLIEDGYDDRSRDTLPLLVTFEGRPVPVPASVRGRRLESIRAAAARTDKSRAARLGRALAAGPLDGVEKIWLDRRVEATLEDSVPQANVPAAWAAGYDGSGVDVAVLDSGIDAEHPDLAGRVADARNFTFEPDTGDGYGHGTHVASTIAGTGAASSGRLRGVADHVRLFNGKVLDRDGLGFLSWLIDGMEWAAVEKDADVVNVSLGAEAQGLDPATEALDRLTKEEGALFVVAAGNSGCDGCVSTPGIAAEALTVGAVDGSDALAWFSARGPMLDDRRIKPDITAPGVDVTAARAAGTGMGLPVDEHYTTGSGTSMATPHVAGATALLLQAREELAPGELKSTLMATAEPHAGDTVYEQGAGRLDAGRAVTTTVIPTVASVSFGNFDWPHDDRDPVTRTITYRNLGPAPATLDLRADGGAEDALSVTPATITIEPGGTADAELALDTSAGEPDLYGGALVATGADGAELRTPVGYETQRERVELTLEGIARDGRPAYGLLTIMDVEDGSVFKQRPLTGDREAPCTEEPFSNAACVRLPVGTYSVLGFAQTMPAWRDSTARGQHRHLTLVGDPELTLDSDTTLTLDARDANEVLIDTPDHETGRGPGSASHALWYRAPEAGPPVSDGVLIGADQLEARLFMQPMEPVTTGEFEAYTRWRLEAPEITMEVTGRDGLELRPAYYDPAYFSDVSSQHPRLDGRLKAPLVDAGLGRPEDVDAADLDGAIALVRRSDEIGVGQQSVNAAAAGARLVAVYNDLPGANADAGTYGEHQLEVPTVRLSHEEGVRLLELLDGRRSVRVVARGETESPFLYDLLFAERGSVPADLTHRVRTRDLARIRNDFHSQLAERATMSEARFQFQPWEQFSLVRELPLTGAPRSRTDYYTADPRTEFVQSVTVPESPYNYAWPQDETPFIRLIDPARKSFAPGDRGHRDWFKGPLAGGLDPWNPIARLGDIMAIAMRGFVDSDGHTAPAWTSPFEEGFKTGFRLYRRGELLASTDLLPSGTVAVPAERDRYRIEWDVANDAWWARVSTRTHTTWTFESARPPAGEVATMPLLDVRYDVDLDLQNRASRRRLRTIDLVVRHQQGAPRIPLSHVGLEISYDGGERWRDAGRLRPRGGGRYSARLDRRPPEGFVALRVHARDRNGNTIEQEIERAFAVRR